MSTVVTNDKIFITLGYCKNCNNIIKFGSNDMVTKITELRCIGRCPKCNGEVTLNHKYIDYKYLLNYR